MAEPGQATKEACILRLPQPAPQAVGVPQPRSTKPSPTTRVSLDKTMFTSRYPVRIPLGSRKSNSSNNKPSEKELPAGKVLSDIADNVWGAERPFIWNGIDVNGRMAVLRLKDGSLWVHSPVGLDDQLTSALAALGPVKHIVSPNYEHVKFAGQWKIAYPEAKLYACPGLQAKSVEVEYDREFTPNEREPPEWAGEVECACLTYEANPLTQKPFFNEVIFWHKPSGYLIVSDLYWRYPREGTAWGTQAWKFGMDRIYAPFYRRFMIKEKDDFQEKQRRILNEWQFDGIIPCHGDVLKTGGKGALKAQLGLT